MEVLTSETCWALNNEIKKASDIKLVSLYLNKNFHSHKSRIWIIYKGMNSAHICRWLVCEIKGRDCREIDTIFSVVFLFSLLHLQGLLTCYLFDWLKLSIKFSVLLYPFVLWFCNFSRVYLFRTLKMWPYAFILLIFFLLQSIGLSIVPRFCIPVKVQGTSNKICL
jgi:hypothetical protein